ncbi:hypothetical protein PPL_02814 [Heterostelium album PN500]|uniref:Kinetochore protein Sos7 coiled-coil domain-containing protein n=1 Tax=Heterostelium pallidum (strain ATCC 26659 / Pp 5 / PN500) TaxID=670386 RepID=D3B349_HETP5|nr:hypothetical protein PPL_02814 [Heterostelium album PN500]EFA83747.1 hypothetical protein PPL_02814 [Heterostelium album PN500]|eukprot:XP_020435864.1 hypothetical protein PPL_02814 [Heterostelium album PN500]
MIKYIYFLLLISLVSSFDINTDIDNDFTITCELLLNDGSSTCNNISTNYATCSNITLCLNWLYEQQASNSMYNTTVILIADGKYDDCPGAINTFPQSELHVFYSPGYSLFTCDGQFVSVNMTYPTSVTFQNIGFSGSLQFPQTKGGLLGFSIQPEYLRNEKPAISLVNVEVFQSSVNGNGSVLYASGFHVDFIDSSFENCNSTMNGGVLYAEGDNTKVSLINSRFTSNGADEEGGVIYGDNVFSLNSTFIGNSALYNGGAIFSVYNMFLNLSTFIDNQCVDSGGGVSGSQNSTTIANSLFQNNYAYSGGALWCSTNSKIENTTFIGNRCTQNGGGLYVGGNLLMTNSTINGSISYNCGGAIYIDQIVTSVQVQFSNFNDNKAIAGGAICDFAKNLTVFNSTFNANHANTGGAIKSYYSELNFMGTEFTNNVASELAGAVYFAIYPNQFLGGVYTDNICKARPISNTFNHQATINGKINVVNVSLALLTDNQEYTVPIIYNTGSSYAKAYNVQGQCINGVASINTDGQLLNCQCFSGYSVEYAEQIGFSLSQYNEIVNDIHKNIFNYLKSDQIDKKKLPNIEKDLNIIQECFQQMKFNYIEIGSKQRFMQSIISLDSNLTSPSPEATNQLESSISKGKKDFKELKDINVRLANEVIAIINQIAEDDQILQKERENIKRLLDDANEQLDKLYSMDQTIEEMQKSDNKLITNNDRLLATIEWYQPYVKVIEKLQGIRMTAGNSNAKELQFELTVMAVQHQVAIKLDQSRQSIISLNMQPTPLRHIDYLTEDFSNISELATLVEELTFALTNHYRREKEIKELSKSYHIQRLQHSNENTNGCTIAVSLQTGHTCIIVFESDYPLHPNVHLYLKSITKNDIQIEFNEIKKHLQETKYDLQQLIEQLLNYFRDKENI